MKGNVGNVVRQFSHWRAEIIDCTDVDATRALRHT